MPKYQGKVSVSPSGYWDESYCLQITPQFALTILDFDTAGKIHFSTEGIKSITSVMDDTNVRVFHMRGLFHGSPTSRPQCTKRVSKSEKVLMSLLGSAEKLGSSNIVLLRVDQSSLQSQREIENLVSF